jgi:hypothetical protein
MQLRELTNVHVLNTAQTQTIKGGARDTRKGSSSSTSSLSLPIRL